tara:strand:+ start:4008 stop:4166 length:159 start_codon:yes stop_codon:yes gene_type:complete
MGKKKASIDDRINDVNLKIEQSMQKRDEYAALVLKCQGALEMLYIIRDDKDE